MKDDVRANNSEESCSEIKNENETKPSGNNFQIETVTHRKRSSDSKLTESIDNLGKQEKYLLNKLKSFQSGQFYSDNFQHFSKNEKIDFFYNFIKSEEEDCKNLPDDMIRQFIGLNFEIDYERTPDTKPDWLDLEKFKRGQKFAMDNFFGVSCAQILSLFILFHFEEGIKPIIFSGKSDTPYKAFKRFVSVAQRVRNWYSEDPWKKGTAAYNDVQIVHKMHAAFRKKLLGTNSETFDAATKIKNAYCPSRDILVKDFQTACPAPNLGQFPSILVNNSGVNFPRPEGMNQSIFTVTQFGFFGLIILYPVNFGIFHATEEDLEAFCHTWRGIGYLLGIDDEFNFCRGTLNDVKQRCNELLEYWALPNFRELTPECEHLMRYVIEGLNYYVLGVDYETCVLYLSEMLNLHTPRLYSSLTYTLRLKHIIIKFVFRYICKLPGVMGLFNKILNNALDKARVLKYVLSANWW